MTGMRKWIAAHRKAVYLAFFTCVWVAGVVLWVRLGHPLGQVLFNAALSAAFLVALLRLAKRRGRDNEVRLDAQGAILVYVRYPDARPGSLSGIWELGVATFEDPSRMRFRPAISETIEAVGRPTTFGALAPLNAQTRKIDRKERKYVPYQVVDAVRLSTDKGDIEVAGKPEALRKLLERIRQEEGTS
jgi:hypothetical protein